MHRDESPLRTLRNVSTEQREAACWREQQLLGTMNSVLQGQSLPILNRVSELYARAKHFLMTFPELDHLGARTDGDYRGAWPFGWGGRPYERSGEGPQVFAYLKPFPAINEFLIGLSAMPINALVYIDGLDPAQIAKVRPTLRAPHGGRGRDRRSPTGPCLRV